MLQLHRQSYKTIISSQSVEGYIRRIAIKKFAWVQQKYCEQVLSNAVYVEDNIFFCKILMGVTSTKVEVKTSKVVKKKKTKDLRCVLVFKKINSDVEHFFTMTQL